jgi:peptidoglycan L-alanyl-D-glutamate endopeptidase CwlK
MSRDTKDLLPLVARKAKEFQKLALANGVDFIITCTYRSIEEQNALYNQPFDKIDNDKDGMIDESDEKVTQAKGGQSFHNHRVAFDIVPILNGKAQWNNDALWSKLGKLGQSIGIEWGGSWTNFKDKPHFQIIQGYSFTDFTKGKVDLKKFA